MVCDLLSTIFDICSEVSKSSNCNLKNIMMFFISYIQDALSLQLEIDMLSMVFRLSPAQESDNL